MRPPAALALRPRAVKKPTDAVALGAPLPSRRAYFGPRTGWLETPVVRRADLQAPRDGPCIVEEYDATCIIPPGARAGLDGFGSILIEL